MTSRVWMISSIACATLGVALLAQDTATQLPPNATDITGIPPARGVYYRASDGWVSLPFTVMNPMLEGRSPLMEVVDLWADRTVAEFPGPHAYVQIGNDSRPIFYLHGISPSDIYLVRMREEQDYREVRMPISGQFRRWAHFNKNEVADLEIQPLGGDIFAVRPHSALTPGEYALASGAQAGSKWIRLGYDFGLVAVRQ